MIRRIPFVLLFLLSPALVQADDPLTISIAQGEVYHHIWGAPSPVPGWCYWMQEVPTPFFHATNEDGYGNMGCPHEFLAHCDTDSMVFRGAWPYIDAEYVTGGEYDAFLSCTVELTAPMELAASREHTGILTSNQMNLTLIHSSGASEEILGEGGPDLIELTLEPGSYTLEMDVEVFQYISYPDQLQPFDCRVALVWEDPGLVVSRSATWDAVKLLYR